MKRSYSLTLDKTEQLGNINIKQFYIPTVGNADFLF